MKVDYDFKFDSINPTKIEGMGKEVETITNEAGGKQSNIPYAFHLIDPEFLNTYVSVYSCDYTRISDIEEAIESISRYERTLEKEELVDAVLNLGRGLNNIFDIARVLKEGAEKYEANNWRLIPAESHLSHAIAHLLAYANGDKQDDHIPHAMCRLMMAYATKESEGFAYTKYIPQAPSEHLPCCCK